AEAVHKLVSFGEDIPRARGESHSGRLRAGLRSGVGRDRRRLQPARKYQDRGPRLLSKRLSPMEMEKSYYVVAYRPEYFEMIRAAAQLAPTDRHAEFAIGDMPRDLLVVAITQGGFGQDVVDDELQVKERFLEHLFTATGIDLPRTPEVF